MIENGAPMMVEKKLSNLLSTVTWYSTLMSVGISELYTNLVYYKLCWEILITNLSTMLWKKIWRFLLLNSWENVSWEIVLMITEDKKNNIIVKLVTCWNVIFNTKITFRRPTNNTFLKIFYRLDTRNAKMLCSIDLRIEICADLHVTL